MQRDVHGLEYSPWKREVEYLWGTIFEQIAKMTLGAQKSSLQTIRETWTSYLAHYGAFAKN